MVSATDVDFSYLLSVLLSNAVFPFLGWEEAILWKGLGQLGLHVKVNAQQGLPYQKWTMWKIEPSDVKRTIVTEK